MPKIRKFTSAIDALEESNENVKECIRKFDEDISSKANKATMTLFANQVSENYVSMTQLAEINAKFK